MRFYLSKSFTLAEFFHGSVPGQIERAAHEGNYLEPTFLRLYILCNQILQPVREAWEKENGDGRIRITSGLRTAGDYTRFAIKGIPSAGKTKSDHSQVEINPNAAGAADLVPYSGSVLDLALLMERMSEEGSISCPGQLLYETRKGSGAWIHVASSNIAVATELSKHRQRLRTGWLHDGKYAGTIDDAEVMPKEKESTDA